MGLVCAAPLANVASQSQFIRRESALLPPPNFAGNRRSVACNLEFPTKCVEIERCRAAPAPAEKPLQRLSGLVGPRKILITDDPVRNPAPIQMLLKANDSVRFLNA